MQAATLQQLLAGVFLFTAIVLLLVVVVLLVRRFLVPVGEVLLEVNGQQMLPVTVGSTVLTALSNNRIFLPAACGRRGICGQCKISVLGEPGPLTPVETVHITRREALQGVRLACMFTVKRDLRIRVPEELLEVRQWRCTVRSNRSIATFMKELVLSLPEGEHMYFTAGDYVLVEAPPHHVRFANFDIDPECRGEWQRYDLFGLESNEKEAASRAYSMANHPGEGDVIMLAVRIALPPTDAKRGTPPGHVSSWLFSLRPGDELLVSGPFGDFHARETQNEMVMIGGGAGIAPMRSIILDQLKRLKTKRNISFWYGARNFCELCYQEEFDQLAAEYENFSWQASLSDQGPDDGWTGHTGFIHSVVYEHYLRTHPAPDEIEYYVCGPPVMNVAVVQMLEDLGVERDNIFVDIFEVPA